MTVGARQDACCDVRGGLTIEGSFMPVTITAGNYVYLGQAGQHLVLDREMARTMVDSLSVALLALSAPASTEEPVGGHGPDLSKLRDLYAVYEAWPEGKHPRNGAPSEEWEPFYASNRARSDLLAAMPALLGLRSAASPARESALRGAPKRIITAGYDQVGR